LSCRPARLDRLEESIPEFLKSLKIPSLVFISILHLPGIAQAHYGAVYKLIRYLILNLKNSISVTIL
jgi:hypothetical protein